ncbi:MAG: MBL fold metallo-hydrolase [Rubrivivax sp.]|nr:MBL fold metallo-hydrolase [Rubrivivax sp.]
MWTMLGIRAFTLIAGLWLFMAGTCMAQQPLSIQNIRGNLYFAKGGNGAHTGFYIGENEVIVIDAKMTADAQKQVIQEIQKMTSKPITRVILTHGDGDHVNGLNAFPKGIRIYGHAQTKKDMEEASKAAGMEYLRDYVPNEIFAPSGASNHSAMDIPAGGTKIQLYFFGPAHTSGDLVVYFPAEKVAFVGDLVFTGRDPLIHRFKGGTSIGLAETLKGLLGLDADVFLSGHSDPLSKKDIEAVLASIIEKQDKVRSMIAEGKSLEEVKKAFNIADAPAKPGGLRFMSLVEVIYLDLTEKK